MSIASARMRALMAAAMVLTSMAASAQIYVRIPDASQIYYQTQADGHVYLRNVSSFDTHALGCCYNYWIDLNTQEGRGIFAALLSAASRNSVFWIAVPDGYTAGAITGSGFWEN